MASLYPLRRDPPARHRPAGRSARSGEVFDALKRDIMLGALAAGTPLVELELAEGFGCSQAPVREALLLLQEEGLVLRQGHRGTRVSDCTADEAVEMFRLRQSLECRGVVRAIARPSPALVDDLRVLVGEMEACAAEGDEYRLAERDRDFHRRLFHDARLPALEPILHRCLVHNHRFKISNSMQARDLAAAAGRHWVIVEAVAARDAAEAVRTLGHHVATIVDLGPDVFDAASGPAAPEDAP